MKLYVEEDFTLVKKYVRISRILYISFFALIVICLTLGLVLSNYYTKGTAMIICSIINALLIVFAVFFIAKTRKYKHIRYEYENLINEPSNEITCEVLSISEKPISLADSSMCYEIGVLIGKTNKTYYLSEVFDPSILKIGERYVLKVAFDYIVEFNHEN